MEPLPALIGFAAAFAAAALSTPLVCRFSRMLGIVDRPSARKVNRRPDIPLMGGISVALGLAIGLLLALQVYGGPPLPVAGHLEGLLYGGILMLVIGAIDDRAGLSAAPKLAVQLFAAGLAFACGFRIDYVTIPVTFQTWLLADWLACLLTVLFIVGVTNAMNLLDGLDGVATGVAVIVGITLTTFCLVGSQVVGLYVGAALVGALLGFLPWNYPPARIFLGDTGALFIGFCLALLALEGYRQASTVPFIVPLLALMVPLIDTSLSILRRLRGGKKIFAADRHHMHHRMLEDSGSPAKAALLMYGMTFIFCMIAFLLTQLRTQSPYFMVPYLLVVGVLTIKILHGYGLFDPERGEGDAPDASRGVKGTGE